MDTLRIIQPKDITALSTMDTTITSMVESVMRKHLEKKQAEFLAELINGAIDSSMMLVAKVITKMVESQIDLGEFVNEADQEEQVFLWLQNEVWTLSSELNTTPRENKE